MARPKPPKRLFKSPDHVSSYEHERSKVDMVKGMSRDHSDVLQNIEFVLVQAHRADSKVDDRIVHEALIAEIRGKTPTDPQVSMVAGLLRGIRQVREDVSDEVWQAALQFVDDSVRRHSALTPGDDAYLRFVSKYVE